MNICFEAWLEVIQREYLRDFILRGGAAVKFIVPREMEKEATCSQQIAEVAQAEGYLPVSIDASKTQVSRIDQCFFQVALQVPWDDLAFALTSRILSEAGYHLPPLRHEFHLFALAERNGRDPTLLKHELNTLLSKTLGGAVGMNPAFRLALIHLCQAQLEPHDAHPVPAGVIQAWLRGELRLLAEIKPALIFQKIGRHNARAMFSSLSNALHLAGWSGLCVTLNLSRCLTPRPSQKSRQQSEVQQDDARYYTSGAVLDVYELLRQFIDATDETAFLFMVVVAPPAFLEVEGRRSVFRYDALRMRIWDEVRDRHRTNPLSALVRL